MKDRIDRILRNTLGLDVAAEKIVRLHGDASYRTYYRVFLSDGRTFIIMQMPKGKSSASEEITNYEGKPDELPFINIAKYLSGRDVPVPKVYHYDEGDKLMLLEDLGDDSLANALCNADDASTLTWYKRAIDLLFEIQSKTKDDSSGKCIAFKRSFDDTLLNWEFDHFWEYGIEARGIDASKSDAGLFREETRRISARIRSLEYGFTLRDFQSRNIFIKNEKMYIIDFQDALLGPSVYDLVSLIRDSYIRLDSDVLRKLLRHFAELSGMSHDDLMQRFDLVTVQRKLKDAGRFVYIDRVKGNPKFLKFIPTSLNYVRGALERLPEYKQLYDVLKRNAPEWNDGN